MPMNIFRSQENKALFLQGMKDGLPIGFAYFAVSFSLGISASLAGLNALQGFAASILTAASAGEYAGFSVIAENGTYIEMFLMTIVASSRYLLMSCALSQKLPKDLSTGHRLGLAMYITDEIFGITIARPGLVKPLYTYGADVVAAPLWAIGTALGIIVGNVLPVRLVSALSVALYGMFIAIIIPPARDNKVILGVVAVSFAMSWLFGVIPGISGISSGTRIIILTVLISSLAAAIFPVEDDLEGCDE